MLRVKVRKLKEVDAKLFIFHFLRVFMFIHKAFLSNTSGLSDIGIYVTYYAHKIACLVILPQESCVLFYASIIAYVAR